jgi:hypothetical protein
MASSLDGTDVDSDFSPAFFDLFFFFFLSDLVSPKIKRCNWEMLTLFSHNASGSQVASSTQPVKNSCSSRDRSVSFKRLMSVSISSGDLLTITGSFGCIVGIYLAIHAT